MPLLDPPPPRKQHVPHQALARCAGGGQDPDGKSPSWALPTRGGRGSPGILLGPTYLSVQRGPLPGGQPRTTTWAAGVEKRCRHLFQGHGRPLP